MREFFLCRSGHGWLYAHSALVCFCVMNIVFLRSFLEIKHFVYADLCDELRHVAHQDHHSLVF